MICIRDGTNLSVGRFDVFQRDVELPERRSGGLFVNSNDVELSSVRRERNKDLRQYVGHTVEVLGRPERESDENDDRLSAIERSELLYITSIRDVADHGK